jgi:hypothetical protein
VYGRPRSGASSFSQCDTGLPCFFSIAGKCAERSGLRADVRADVLAGLRAGEDLFFVATAEA